MTSSVWDDDGSDAIGVVVPGPGITSITSVGDGEEVVAGVNDVTGAATFKTIVAGNRIALTATETELEIGYTGDPVYTVDNASTSYYFTAAADQVDFTIPEEVTLDTVHAFVNGLKLLKTIDFSVNVDTNVVTLVAPCGGGERVEFIVSGAFIVEYDMNPLAELIVEATTLATGEDATANFNLATNTLSLGLPRGPQGVGFVWRNDWSYLQTYSVNDVVACFGRIWISIHADNTNKVPGNEPAYWQLYIRTPHFAGSWADDVQYYVNDIVYHAATKSTWIAKFDNIDSEPILTVDWSVLAVSGVDGDTGTAGNGIADISRTSGTGAPGTIDTYTITYTDATTDTFTVYNGANGAGDVVGPAAATDGNIVLFNGTTGKLVKNSAVAPSSFATSGHNHDATYAPIAKGVTNGDSHDHNGGDGGTIAYGSISGTPDLSVYAKKSADADVDMNDYKVANVKTVGFTGYDNGSKSSSFTLDLNNGQRQKVTFTGSGALTITLTAPSEPGTYKINMVNAGLRTITFAHTSGSPVLRKQGGTALSAFTSSGTDLLILDWDGTDYFISQSLNWKA